MRTLIARATLLAGCVVLTYGCASRPLPRFEQPLARAAVMNIRTTAYTHTEDDHVQYTNHNALGGILRSGAMHSAAADWSRWPAGSIFRIRETGELYQVDDYGWALSGTNTIDLYKPSREAMNAWGVRRVTIENLRWGDPRESLTILRPRSRYAHIKRMIAQLEERMPDWLKDGFTAQQAGSLAPAATIAMATPSQQPQQPLPPIARAASVSPSTSASTGGFQPPTRASDSGSAPAVRTAQTARSSGGAGNTGSTGTATTREAFLNSYH